MRKKLIAGNWKMNTGYKESEKLAGDILKGIGKENYKRSDILLCPPFTSLGIVKKVIEGSGIKLGAQNLYYENDGAYTGEISASMLKSIGCEYVIIGHSERRKFLHENDRMVNQKIHKALEYKLKPILCVGESKEEREDEIFEGVVDNQITSALSGVSIDNMQNIVIAYEPVWAIGTGLHATPKQISSMHGFIGEVIERLYNAEIADDIMILYGGSVNDENCKEIFNTKRVDGALVGGASIKPEIFVKIAEEAGRAIE